MRVTTDADGTLVRIDGLIVEGWLEDAGCPTCGARQVYSVAYDATFCPDCNVWLELRCPEPECVHCRCRPATPRTTSV